ncbi:MAG: hypothetical protein J1F64_07885 [Oscillospiraceae bacterium]|nr:hypothetical protein [Oscillospiraceae bacterium]
MAKNIHSGHRERIRAKMKTLDSDMIESHEMLEFLLFNVMAQKNTNELAHILLDHFGGSLSNIFNSSLEELSEVDGIGPQAALFIHTVPILANLYTISKNTGRFRITVKNLPDYCLSAVSGIDEECIFITLLNSSGEIISEHIAGKSCFTAGSLVDLRKILTYIVNSNSAAVLITHKCDCGDGGVNRNIITNMKSLSFHLRALNIPLVDYVIINNNDFISMRNKPE